MKELSVFIDESGDFGELTERPPYYLVTLVFHDQSIDITEEIRKLEEAVRLTGMDIEYIPDLSSDVKRYLQTTQWTTGESCSTRS